MNSEDFFVEVNNVTFGYEEKNILSDINLRIPRGKVIAIMGGSGCGKTTLLKLISGQKKPRKGEIYINGQAISSLDKDGLYQLRHNMGMLFQQGALFTDLSVFENVAYPMRELTNLPEEMIRDLVMMKLHAVGLHGAEKLMISELSGGMLRRVALARAIALDPSLILFDEPFAGLDPISLGIIGRLIRKLNDALGATSIMVTHDVQESLKIVDYVYFIAEGKIIAEGSSTEVNESDTPFVKQFINGKPEGPVPFHYPAKDYVTTLLE